MTTWHDERCVRGASPDNYYQYILWRDSPEKEIAIFKLDQRVFRTWDNLEGIKPQLPECLSCLLSQSGALPRCWSKNSWILRCQFESLRCLRLRNGVLIANRVAAIQKLTAGIKSHHFPPNILSRGRFPEVLALSYPWFYDPTYLEVQTGLKPFWRKNQQSN